jgi:hypothetical protein
MSAEPKDIAAVEGECPFCGAKIDLNHGNIYFCGTEIESQIRTTTCWSRETRMLQNKLSLLEQELKDKLTNPNIVWVLRKDLKVYLHRNTHHVEEIEEAFNNLLISLTGDNPVDNPDSCLACMGATGPAVRHTCKPK